MADKFSETVSDVAPSPQGPDNTVSVASEGGAAGWLTVFGAFWGLFATFGLLNAFGTFEAYYIQNQLAHYTQSDISWIGSLQLCIFFITGAPVGKLYDSHGPRRLILLGTIIYTFGTMMTSLCHEFYQFILAQGVVTSVGMALVFYPCISATVTHFRRLRGTASSIVASGSSAGGVAFPFILDGLFYRVGFSWGVRIVGFIGLACCIVAVLCCSSALPPNRSGGPPKSLAGTFNDRAYLTCALGAMITSLGVFVPYFYVPQYALFQLRTSLSRASSLLSIINAGSLAGRILAGIAADYLGLFITDVACNFTAGIFCVSLWYTAHSFSGMVAFTFMYGVASGAFIALMAPCVARMSRMDQLGLRLGGLYALQSIPCLISTPIAGAILKAQDGSFHGLIIWAGVTICVGALVGGSGFYQVVLRTRRQAQMGSAT